MRYVALLRGIGPLHPNMRNARFVEVFEELGFTNVATIATTGNLVFDSPSRSVRSLESRIEAAWPERLDFHSTTIVRTAREVHDLIGSDPFAGRADDAASRFQVTFLKRPSAGVAPPTPSTDRGWEIVSADDRQVCWTIDTTRSRTPDGMRAMERAYGLDITTRAWRTVLNIAKKLG